MAKNAHDTPAMRQFRQFKQQHPDCVLLFRMGDFYELFYDDAKVVAKALGLTLTQRTEGIPMAGVPYHQLDNYLSKLIAEGFRVAVCDQVEDASQAKGLVKRDVTRVVTPGTLTDESLLDEGRENPLAAVVFSDDDHATVAVVELSTGAFGVASLTSDELLDELQRLNPSELLYVETSDGQVPKRVERVAGMLGCATTGRPAWQFRQAEAKEVLLRQFGVNTLTGFGLEEDDAVIGPAGAAVSYLLETQKTEEGRLAHLQPPRRIEQSAHLIVDAMALRALEIERTMRSGESAGSLLSTLNDCRTAMGKRMLRQWLCYPLRDLDAIAQRQRCVGAIVDDPKLSDDLKEALDTVQDVQRICGRIAIGRPTPRDLVALGQSVTHADTLRGLLEARPAFAPMIAVLDAVSGPLAEFGKQVGEACVDAPPLHMREGGLIQDGYDKQLDEFRTLQRDANGWLADYQKVLIEETGIDRLKVGYNKVFGYYIEVSRAQASKMPDQFTRKQTLKNAERYITPKLKEYENDVLGAQTKAVAREAELFEKLLGKARDRLGELQRFAELIAGLDVLACFARRAVRFSYTKPDVVDEPVLRIDAGRHPVLDEALADQFVPNDAALGEPDATLALITGPNMAGKSTYIRQAALLTLMAHTGSYLPATSATIGLTDRIFTRIGASDELHAGQSTFMVEMVETASICHHATARSLVILDEIGRGTSTLDGLSLAWAIAEHLAGRRCRTMFATHYHELTQLSEQFENVTNLNVTVREWADEVVFLHRIQPGTTDRSYGVHVAKIAGLPGSVVDRANTLMGQFELHTTPGANPGAGPTSGGNGKAAGQPVQPSLFTEYVEHPAMAKLRGVELESLSPMAAFDLLRALRDEMDER